MSAFSSELLKVQISSDNVTYYDIGGKNNATLDEMAELVDKTELGDTYKKRLKVLLDTSFTVSGFLSTSDTGQLKLRPGQEIWIKYLPDGVNGIKVPMIGEKFSRSGSTTTAQAFNATVQGNGEPVAVP